MDGPPLVVMEEASPSTVAQLRAELSTAGWPVVDGWANAGRGVVCHGRVDDDAAAQRAVLAAVAGAGVLVEGVASREVLDRLCDDLRRLGPLDHRIGGSTEALLLNREERALLELLMGGASLGEAARALHVSRRTADRRLATARRTLGASSTNEAVVLASRYGLRPRTP